MEVVARGEVLRQIVARAGLDRFADRLLDTFCDRPEFQELHPHVRRNTLRDRINRISELTGVDLDHAYRRGLTWLAWLHRRDGARS